MIRTVVGLLIIVILVNACIDKRFVFQVSDDIKLDVKNYADSINLLKIGDSIPAFLYDPCLDCQSKYFLDLHHRVSIRKMIVDRVTNMQAIQYILAQKNDALYLNCKTIKPIKDTTAKMFNPIRYPLINEPFSELLQDRLFELTSRIKF